MRGSTRKKQKDSEDLPVVQQPVAKPDRRRWSARRSPLASSVSPALRAAVRRLDETRREFTAANSGPLSP